MRHTQVDNPSYTATAVETYQLDVESTALVSSTAISQSLGHKEIFLSE